MRIRENNIPDVEGPSTVAVFVCLVQPGHTIKKRYTYTASDRSFAEHPPSETVCLKIN